MRASWRLHLRFSVFKSILFASFHLSVSQPVRAARIVDLFCFAALGFGGLELGWAFSLFSRFAPPLLAILFADAAKEGFDLYRPEDDSRCREGGYARLAAPVDALGSELRTEARQTARQQDRYRGDGLDHERERIQHSRRRGRECEREEGGGRERDRRNKSKKKTKPHHHSPFRRRRSRSPFPLLPRRASSLHRTPSRDSQIVRNEGDHLEPLGVLQKEQIVEVLSLFFKEDRFPIDLKRVPACINATAGGASGRTTAGALPGVRR